MSDDTQKKMIQLQILEANLKALQERINFLAERMNEIESTKLAIEDMRHTKPNEALVPLGSGSFVHGRIENTDEIIKGIGGGVALKKSGEEATAILDSALKDMEKNFEELKSQMLNSSLEFEKIQEEIEKTQK
jgi:prefoldin alpha subunit